MVSPEEPDNKPRLSWRDAINGSVIASFWLSGALAAVELITRIMELL